MPAGVKFPRQYNSSIVERLDTNSKRRKLEAYNPYIFFARLTASLMKGVIFMALPIDRCLKITENSSVILAGYIAELMTRPTPQRQHEIERDSKLIRLILKSIWKPHADVLQDLIDEDTLRELGII